jgi:Uma2 family endonuclease
VPAFDLAPDWVCEVLSPGNEALDRSLKMPRYAEAGVSHAWLLDPTARTVEVYARGSGGWHLFGRHDGDAVVRLTPFEAVEIDLAGLWER